MSDKRWYTSDEYDGLSEPFITYEDAEASAKKSSYRLLLHCRDSQIKVFELVSLVTPKVPEADVTKVQ